MFFKFIQHGAPKRSRTPNLLIRSQMLYPIELWAQLILSLKKNGGFSWNRTNDTKIFSLVLCQLSYEATWRFVRDLNPWSLAWQASVITTTPTNHGCGSRIWTNDLWVMSPASYQTAPSRDIMLNKNQWRRKRDSNPCADFSTSRFSRPVPSTRLGYSSIKIGAPGRSRTGTSFYTRRILSPVRLPIPPLRHK